jgi:hypothetical protein
MAFPDEDPANFRSMPPGTAVRIRLRGGLPGGSPSLCLPVRLFLQGGLTWWAVPVIAWRFTTKSRQICHRQPTRTDPVQEQPVRQAHGGRAILCPPPRSRTLPLFLEGYAAICRKPVRKRHVTTGTTHQKPPPSAVTTCQVSTGRGCHWQPASKRNAPSVPRGLCRLSAGLPSRNAMLSQEFSSC